MVRGEREVNQEHVEKNEAGTAVEAEPDPYENDPFFKQVFDRDWNACIGRQGHEQNYLDGYIEAAIELADAIIEKKMFGKRDTLVLPILYNARHAVELALKFATDRLIKAGVIKDEGRGLSHKIKAYWDHLHGSAIGDEKRAVTIVALKPYIDSLSQIDSDGQELRYHRNRDNDTSLANYATANLWFIRDNLRVLEKLLSSLKDRTVDFLNERATGSYTNRCSRTDLFTIARLLPRREDWATEAFGKSKAAVKARYGLENRQFSLALDRIQESREMRAILGLESALLHIADEEIVWTVEQWRRIHPVRARDEEEADALNYSNTARIKGMQEWAEVHREVVEAIKARLSPEALADLEAMYCLDRDRVYSESYERMVARVLKEHAVVNNPTEKILQLMEKTNFLMCVQSAAVKLGRLALAKRLKTL